MAKKKQADFQKTKLRVGKTLPKGKNVTDTSFKTRKIVTHDQLKAIPGNVSLKELLNYLGHNNVSTKKETLHKLNNYVLEKKDTLSLFFPDILKKVGGTLLEDDAGVRDVAIDVMHTCLRQLSDVQISCFAALLTSYLTCMMTHCNNSIRKDSLKFLDKILNTHPNVICHSIKVLSTLLNLISSMVHQKCSLRGRKRKLDEHISSSITSQEWRVEVLKRIYIFLQCTLAMEKVYENENEEKHEVYWDAEKPLFLPLYLRGGTTPVPLESLNITSDLKSTNSKEFKDFIYDLVPLLSEVIKGEISSKQSAASNIVEPSVVKHLNIVVQILCCLGEWLNHKSSFQVVRDKEFNKLLSNIVCRQLLKRFPYVQHDSSYIKKKVEKTSESECMQLNLGVCYLCCLFVLDSDSTSFEMEKAMITYLDDVFRVCSAMCYKSISLMLKISKILIMSTNVNATYKNGILLGLYGILEVHKLSLCAKSLYSFFMDVSLNYDLKYLLDSEGMTTWFNVILKEVVFMMESGAVNKKFLKYIRQICTRKYSCFLELLNKVKHENLLNLLKYEDEEFQLTIIHLICSLNRPHDLLQDLVEMISNPSFSLKTASRIIHLLHSRFLGQDVPAKEKFLFLQFLLNVGCDTPVLTDPSWESSEKSSDMLRTVLESCHFELHPSSKWERHLKLTKICFECLPTYMQIEAFTVSTVLFIKTTLLEHTKLPIHCVIALLKLRREAYDMYQDEHLVSFYSELIFSSMMYLSVMLIGYKEEGLESYAIPELQKSLQLEREDVSDIISIINSNIYNFGENELYHALRMTLFLIHTNILRLEDRHSFFDVLEKINSTCQRSKLLHPLWINICKFFQFI